MRSDMMPHRWRCSSGKLWNNAYNIADNTNGLMIKGNNQIIAHNTVINTINNRNDIILGKIVLIQVHGFIIILPKELVLLEALSYFHF